MREHNRQEKDASCLSSQDYVSVVRWKHQGSARSGSVTRASDPSPTCKRGQKRLLHPLVHRIGRQSA